MCCENLKNCKTMKLRLTACFDHDKKKTNSFLCWEKPFEALIKITSNIKFPIINNFLPHLLNYWIYMYWKMNCSNYSYLVTKNEKGGGVLKYNLEMLTVRKSKAKPMYKFLYFRIKILVFWGFLIYEKKNNWEKSQTS